MVQFIDEFGARVWLPVQTIKYFKENISPFSKQHKANSVIETIYSDIFYVMETCEEICEMLFGKKEEEEND